MGALNFGATDRLILATLGVFTLLALVFSRQVEGWWVLCLKNAAAAAVYLLLNQLGGRAGSGWAKFWFRTAAVTLAYAYLFGAVDKLQLILHGRWLDSVVVDGEQRLFGAQPTLWLQQFTTPALTEWLMFCYVVYIPLYPALCAVIYHLRGPEAVEDYFFTLGLTNILCDLGFILFPVAGPIAALGKLYTVPLKGYAWTWLGELVRSRLHYVGGSIPSPHAAAATVMWAMAYRYHRPSFYVLAPIILSLYVSTFYLRYHYLTDAFVGIAVAVLALRAAPTARKAIARPSPGSEIGF